MIKHGLSVMNAITIVKFILKEFFLGAIKDSHTEQESEVEIHHKSNRG